MTMAMVNPLRFAADDIYKRQLLINRLHQAGGWFNWRLATVLVACTPELPCCSGACILCGRRFQLAAVDLIEQEIRGPSLRTLRGRMSAATIIPASGVAAPNALTAEVCKSAIADIATAIRQSGLSTSICGFDVSLNEDAEGEIPAHWVAHGHAVFSEWLSEDEEAALRDAVGVSPLVKRRVKVDKLDARANGPLYAVKPDRGRRVSYINDKHSHHRAPHRATHRRGLRPWQAVALAQVEHELGLFNRLIITGISENAVRAALKGLYWPQDGP